MWREGPAEFLHTHSVVHRLLVPAHLLQGSLLEELQEGGEWSTLQQCLVRSGWYFTDHYFFSIHRGKGVSALLISISQME